MQTNTTGKYYILTNDLDFTNIAYPEINFTGHLDGQNHTLSNITAKGTGVFNDLGDYNHSSSVQNLQVQNLIISPTTGNTLGGLASVASNVTITNVHLKSGSITNTKHAFNDLAATGGFIGNTDDKTVIDRCSSSLTVNATKNVGGFIGLNQNATISNSQALGKVTGQQNTGSFIGTQYTNTNPKLPQTHNIMPVSILRCLRWARSITLTHSNIKLHQLIFYKALRRSTLLQASLKLSY